MSIPSSRYDLLLCGGGIVGLSIAWEAVRFGWRVAVVDSGEIGRGSSWAGAGILPSGALQAAADPLEQLRSLSHALHPDWAARLHKQSGIDNEFRLCGGLYLARTQAEWATLAANQSWWREYGIPFEAWTASECMQHVPALQPWTQSNPTLGGWYLPNDARLRNPRHVAALVNACRAQGVTLIEHCPVQGLVSDAGTIVGAQTQQGTLTAERYCVTNGAWGSLLLDSLHVPSGILPVRGQMLLFRLNEPPFSMVINDGHRYLVPRDDGHVLAGSCEEEVGFRNETTDDMIAELQSWAQSLCPALSVSHRIKVWSGLRPGSFDGYPYLSSIPGFQNGFVAAGHFRHGLHWSTATAVLMVQLMRGEPTSIDLTPFHLQRGHTSR